MAIPGYHDPAYDPIITTGEAAPEDKSLEAIARKLAAAIKNGGSLKDVIDFKAVDPDKMAAATRLARKFLNFGTTLKSTYPSAGPEDSSGLMTQGETRGVGLGDITLGDAPESWGREAAGDTAWTQYGRVPLPVAKPGRAGDVLNQIGTLPFGAASQSWAKLPAALGAVRRTTDKVAPGVGRDIAEQLWRKDNPLWGPPVDEYGDAMSERALRDLFAAGPPQRDVAVQLQANAALPDLEKSFANYFTKYAGMPDDPLRKLPQFTRHNPAPNNQFYNESDLQGMPLRVAKPYEARPDPAAIGLARDQRPELEFPPTTSAASGTDDLMGASLGKSDEVLDEIKRVEPYLTQSEEELTADLARLRGLMTAVTRDDYYANEYLGDEAVKAAIKMPKEKLEKMGLTPGKVDEFLQEMGAADPTARLAAPLDLQQDHLGGAAQSLKNTLRSREFRDYVASLPPETIKSKPFHTIYEGFAAKTRNDFIEWKKKQVAPPVQQALNPETGKPAPLGVWPGTNESLFPPDHGWYQVTPDQVLYEGTSLNHCLGKEVHGHPRAIREGREIAYSFRTGDNKPLMTVAVYPERDGGFQVAEIKAINNQQPHNVQDRRLPVEAAAFIEKMGFRLADYDDARYLQRVMERVAQNPDYIKEGAAAQAAAAAAQGGQEISDRTLDKIASLFTDYELNKQWGRDLAIPKDPGRGPFAYTREKDISPGAERWEIGMLDLENPGVLDPLNENVEGVFKTEIAKFLGGAKEPSPRIKEEITKRAALEEEWASGKIQLRPGFPQGQSVADLERSIERLSGPSYAMPNGNLARIPIARVYDGVLGDNVTRLAQRNGRLWQVSTVRPPGFADTDKYKGLYWIRPLKYSEITQGQYDWINRFLAQ